MPKDKFKAEISSSNLRPDSVAQKAIDGLVSSENGFNVAKTLNETNPWLIIDMEQVRKIHLKMSYFKVSMDDLIGVGAGCGSCACDRSFGLLLQQP